MYILPILIIYSITDILLLLNFGLEILGNIISERLLNRWSLVKITEGNINTRILTSESIDNIGKMNRRALKDWFNRG